MFKVYIAHPISGMSVDKVFEYFDGISIFLSNRLEYLFVVGGG